MHADRRRLGTSKSLAWSSGNLYVLTSDDELSKMLIDKLSLAGNAPDLVLADSHNVTAVAARTSRQCDRPCKRYMAISTASSRCASSTTLATPDSEVSRTVWTAPSNRTLSPTRSTRRLRSPLTRPLRHQPGPMQRGAPVAPANLGARPLRGSECGRILWPHLLGRAAVDQHAGAGVQPGEEVRRMRADSATLRPGQPKWLRGLSEGQDHRQRQPGTGQLGAGPAATPSANSQHAAAS